MSDINSISPIAHIHCDFKSKFGIPRQSGIVESVVATIVFEPQYRNPDAFRGIEQFSHLWLIWEFSESRRDEWTPTVRPPKLGGNTRVGVFATRSPFRPNPIGLSSVRLLKFEPSTSRGPLLTVCGSDLLDNTPIYDIKPYIPYTDCHTDASCGFALSPESLSFDVFVPESITKSFSPEYINTVCDILSQDPRPGYQNDKSRVYVLEYGEFEVSFTVDGNTVRITNIK